MTNPRSDDAPPAPRIKTRSGPSLVWLIPLITALVGGWLIVKTVSEKGPRITITFETAAGIQAGKTKIKYKDIEIGVVEKVDFSPDFSHVILHAQMAREAAPFLRRNTRFWVVKPRLTLRGVSNLGTLVSGVHIEIEPGQGAPQTRFVGLESAPVVKGDVAGIKILLLAPRLGSIDTGSPITYQGIQAGEVLGWELGNDRRSVFIHGFVKAPYDELVQGNTRFWNVSGLDVSLDAEGISVRTASVQSLLYGGIAFDTPQTLEPVKTDVRGLVFTLHDDLQSIQETAYTQKVTFILFFDGSVRGLTIGAPVEFQGIKIGSVVDVRLEFDRRDASFRIPVLIEIEPERIVERGAETMESPAELLQGLVARGLRAQLQTGSLLTGQLFIDLGMHPDTPVRLVADDAPYPELPTVPASLEQMTTSVKRILARLETVEMDKIGSELLQILKGGNTLVATANRLVGQPDLEAAVHDLKIAMGSVNRILETLDARIDPVTSDLSDAANAGKLALQRVHTTLGLVDRLLQPDSPLQYRYIELAEELAETARSVRTLVDLLERNPNAIIFGKEASGGN